MRLKPALICPDSHRPYHDPAAWALMLRVGSFLRPRYLISIGDLVDFYTVSSHSKHSDRVRFLKDEIADANVGMDELDELGAKHKYFIAGNHEDRLTRYLRDKAPELFGLISIPGLLRLRERRWDYTPYKESVRIGKAYYTHDVGKAGRNASFAAMDTFQHSVVTGHAHRMQYLVEGNAIAEAKLSAQFGWLGDASKVDYMHRVNVNKNWALGFGVGYIDEATGVNYLTPVPIVPVGRDYTCVVNGKGFRISRSYGR